MEYTDKEQRAVYEVELCREALTAECTVDYTLPDYLPELRRILRVDARPIPAERYLDDTHAELSGLVAFCVVYADGEGQLAALSQNGEYTLTAKTPMPARVAFADVECDAPVCRLSGPRRLTLRTTVRTRPHLLGEVALPEYSVEGLECLPYTTEGRISRVSEMAEVALSDSIAVPAIPPDSLRLLSCDGGILFDEVRPQEGGARLRGTAVVRILGVDEGGAPHAFHTEIPFERELACEGATAKDGCLPVACLSTLNARPSGDGEGGTRIELDGVAECSVRMLSNRPMTVNRAVFSPTFRTEATVASLSLERLLGTATGSYTVSGSCPVPVGEARAAAILDAVATPTVRRVCVEDGRTVVSGDVRVRLLLAGAPEGESGKIECSSVELCHPFRIEPPLSVLRSVEPRYDVRVDAPRVRARIEEGGYAADTELSLSVAAFFEESFPYVSGVSRYEGEEYPTCQDAMTVVYPDGGDTLWSVSERYHRSPARVAEENRIPLRDAADAGLPTSLDGISYLIV